MYNFNGELWVVVDVRSGIPVSVTAYTDEDAAVNRQKELQTEINPEDDEIGIFFVRPNELQL